MIELLSTWWAWLAFALLLGMLELFAPGFIFVGFSVGALATGLLLALGVTFGGVAWILLFFAVVSLIAWAVMYKLFGGKGRQVTSFDEDINEG